MINFKAVIAIYFHEIERTKRTIFQSIISPILTTSLYFIIFGSAIGSRIKEIDGVSYGMYIDRKSARLTGGQTCAVRSYVKKIRNTSYFFYS